MNINLVYKDSEYNFDMLKTTPLSYLYKISEEKFKLQQNHIELYFEDRCIPNKNKATNDFFGSTKKCTNISNNISSRSFCNRRHIVWVHTISI